MKCYNEVCPQNKENLCKLKGNSAWSCAYFISADGVSDSPRFSGSVKNDDNQDWMLEKGFWVKSKTTGRLYAPKHIPDSDVDSVIINGIWFDRSE